MRPAEALRRVLAAEISAGSLAVRDYAIDFNALWSADSALPETVVVLWQDTPPGDAAPVATGPYVSPIHWAAYFAQRALRAGRPCRVTIVDQRPAAHRAEIPLCGLLQGTSPLGWPPWLRLLGPADLIASSGDTLRDALLPAAALADADDRSFHLLLDQVRKHLTDPEDRDTQHAFANLLGPMLLLGRAPTPVPAIPGSPGVSEKRASHRSALRDLLVLTGLLPERLEPAGDRPVTLPADARVFLLDDQWHHGWGEWLCELLGAGFEPPAEVTDNPLRISRDGSGVEVFAARHPGWLLEKLTDGPRPFGLTLDPQRRRGAEILLLDLRLFSENGTAEQEFLKRLRSACRRYENRPSGFTTGELEEAGVSPTSRTLLGRLVALTDCSFPVVLFSSTSDRAYIEPFAAHPNVITGFAKPGRQGQQLSGYSGTTVGHALLDACHDARRLCDARAFIHQLRQWARDGRAAATSLARTAAHSSEPAADPSGPPPWRHAELYIDESRRSDSPGFKAGGYAVLYPGSAQAAQGFPFLDQWGFCREQSPGSRPPVVERQLLKQKALRDRDGDAVASEKLVERAQYVRDIVGGAGCGLAAFIVEKGSASDSSLPGPDACYRALATTAIEIFLFDWLPALEAAWGVSPGTLTASVFLGTRERPAESLQDVGELIALQWNFGLPFRTEPVRDGISEYAHIPAWQEVTPPLEERVGYSGTSPLLPKEGGPIHVAGRSMGHADAYSLVIGSLHHRTAALPKGRLKSAVAVTMKEFKQSTSTTTFKSPPELPRQIHYATDDLLGSSESWGIPPIRDALDRGARIAYSDGLEAFLRASRAFDAKDIPRALTELRRASEAGVPPSVLRWLALRCEAMVLGMNKDDYLAFARGVVLLHGRSLAPGGSKPPPGGPRLDWQQKSKRRRKGTGTGPGGHRSGAAASSRAPVPAAAKPPTLSPLVQLDRRVAPASPPVDLIRRVKVAIEYVLDRHQLAAGHPSFDVIRAARFEGQLLVATQPASAAILNSSKAALEEARDFLDAQQLLVVGWSDAAYEVLREAFAEWEPSVYDRGDHYEVVLGVMGVAPNLVSTRRELVRQILDRDVLVTAD